MKLAVTETFKHLRTLAALSGAALLFASAFLGWRQAGFTPPVDSPPAEAKFRAFPSPSLRGTEGDPAMTIRNGVRCTIYYTPRESGFRADAGFDVTPTTKPGLSGHTFPRDFLKAVQVEGFGRMRQAVEGKAYLRYWSGRWGFADAPVDHRGRRLQPLRSAAVGRSETSLPRDTVFRVNAAGLPAPFADARWVISDTGSGLAVGQIDFYWGEDDPLGPGPRLTRPRGMPAAIVQPMIIVMR